ncbi:MAG: hypothetical protein RLZZ66_513 [Pseudomonadota bacterium]
MPDLVKIGFSTKDPDIRAAEFNNTGNPYPYTVKYQTWVNEPKNIEKSVHKILKDRGFHENKEWFNCSFEIAVSAIRETAGNDIIHESVKFPFDVDKPFGLAHSSTKDLERNESQKIGKFIVQGGIATDTETGLMWLRFAYGQQWERNEVIGDAIKMEWQDALTIPEKFNQTGYADYNDWRVPNIDELKTLSDRNKGRKGNYIDADVFPENEKFFWSSSPSNRGSDLSWYVNFYYYGSSGLERKIYDYNVRLVRGNLTRESSIQFKSSVQQSVESSTKLRALPSTMLSYPVKKIGKFIVQGGIATDTETGLMWLRFAYGQDWKKDCVIGEAKYMYRNDAMGIPERFNRIGYASYKDWRVPNIDELKTLIDNSKGKAGNYIDADVFPENEMFFWSSSFITGVVDDYAAWSVCFDDGSIDWHVSDYGYNLRLVRN